MCVTKTIADMGDLKGFPPSVQTKSQISDRQPDVAADFCGWLRIGTIINCFCFTQ